MSNRPPTQQPGQPATTAPQYQPQWNPTFSPPRAYQAPVQLQSPAYIPQYYTQPVAQSYVAPPVVQQPIVYQQPVVTQSVVAQPVVTQPVVQQQPIIKGESRVEYIPYEKSVIEYEEVRQKIQVPREKYVTEYQAIEYQTEYVPQVFYDKVTEYVPVDRYQERVEYYPVERQVVHQPQIQTVAQPVVQQSYVAQPVVTQSYVAQPVVQQSYVTQTVPVVSQPIQYAQYPQYAQPATQTIYGPPVPIGNGPIPASQLPAAVKTGQFQQTPQK
ncbi:unnamed protein product (macronuclear) [Paramecium tetraurelia]|uniref:Chromosome undetermined scaffold_25, whole genome shotgun sequence n=1 Tax=Paramecium tetraurelia TaxID=5888 RepID=Q3SDG9_PARTE|nr:uncharacterized protein GSPATT00009618001 [Paramecium tetraurelia]CAI39389.1 EPI38 [Paramecium tetraurelia]CAK73303.1 unnamed protein product [Paramecium tetraurelia]|eukprot:XP_001440700.1 hypothetical protein (macronuclear) [Paramecium tetraurelia strain d4-2]